MGFTLPEYFADDANEVVVLLRRYDLCADYEIKNDLLSNALAASCRLLGSLNLEALSARIDEIYRLVQEHEKNKLATKTWSDEIFAKPSHFHRYLDETEEEILKSVGIKADNRKRILGALRPLRLAARTQAGKLATKQIIGSVRALKDEVCRLQDQSLESDRQPGARQKVLETALAASIAANAAGSDMFPVESPAVAASITLGAVGLGGI